MGEITTLTLNSPVFQEAYPIRKLLPEPRKDVDIF